MRTSRPSSHIRDKYQGGTPMSVSSRVPKTPRSRAKANARARSDGLGPPANRSTSARSRSRFAHSGGLRRIPEQWYGVFVVRAFSVGIIGAWKAWNAASTAEPALSLSVNPAGRYRPRRYGVHLGNIRLRHPLNVWRDPSDRISALRIVMLVCLFVPLAKAIYDSEAIRLDARPITNLIHR